MTKSGGKKRVLPEGSGSRTYARYVAAFERLLAQNPERNDLENPELHEIVAEGGRVPVTQDNVAKEAGLSRKAISGEGCRFPLLGGRIKAARSSHGVADTTTATLKRLRTELAEVTQSVVVLRSKAAEAIIRADRLEQELEEQRKLNDRLRQQVAGRRRAPTRRGGHSEAVPARILE